MKILIIGGSGYLGKRLTCQLLKSGKQVYWINQSGKNFYNLKIEQCFTVEKFLNSNIFDSIQLDWVINCACKYETNNTPYNEMLDANFYIPQRIFQFCCKKGISKYLSIGTALPDDFNFYSKSKALFTELSKWTIQNHYETCLFYNIVLQNYYGEGEPNTRFLPYCISCMKNNEPVNMTEGKQIRDYIYIEDVVNNLLHLIEHPRQKGYYDIPLGTGTGISLKELVLYIREVLASTSIINFGVIPMRANEPKLIADQEQMKAWGLFCQYDWKNGIQNMLEQESLL